LVVTGEQVAERFVEGFSSANLNKDLKDKGWTLVSKVESHSHVLSIRESQFLDFHSDSLRSLSPTTLKDKTQEVSAYLQSRGGWAKGELKSWEGVRQLELAIFSTEQDLVVQEKKLVHKSAVEARLRLFDEKENDSVIRVLGYEPGMVLEFNDFALSRWFRNPLESSFESVGKRLNEAFENLPRCETQKDN
jgi:hypothetical protein